MKLLISSGDFREIVDFSTRNRKVAHRLGCIKAVLSGKRLGIIIRTSTHVDAKTGEYFDDDLFLLVEGAENALKIKKSERRN